MNEDGFFFLIQPEFVIGTPDVIESSENTRDVTLQELIRDPDLQKQLNLDPVALQGMERAILYLSSFILNNPEEVQARQKYLRRDGMLRILYRTQLNPS